MKMKRMGNYLFILLASLFFTNVSLGTYIHGDAWDFTGDYLGTNEVYDKEGNLVWQYSGGKSTDTPSKAQLLSVWSDTLKAWTGSDTTYYAWIGDGEMHAASTLTSGEQRTPFLVWISPLAGSVKIELDITEADMNYQVHLFLNDYVLDSQTGSANDYSHTETINVGVGDTITLRIKQDIPLRSPTVRTRLRVTFVPEPVTFGLLIAGIGLLRVRRPK